MQWSDGIHLEWSHQQQARALTDQMWVVVSFTGVRGNDLTLGEQHLSGQGSLQVVGRRSRVEDEGMVSRTSGRERHEQESRRQQSGEFLGDHGRRASAGKAERCDAIHRRPVMIKDGSAHVRLRAHRTWKLVTYCGAWPKRFNDLRASCENELMRRYPAHVVHAWIGHSAAVAEAHYLQVTGAVRTPRDLRETRCGRELRANPVLPTGLEPVTFRSVV